MDLEADDLARFVGVTLGEIEKKQLAAGLRYAEGGRWAQLEVAAGPGAVLARSLAGLFLLGERVLVVSPDGQDRFRRVMDLIGGSEILSSRVRRSSALNGYERIDLDDAAMRFVRPDRIRGYSPDLAAVYGDLTSRQRADLAVCVMSRPDPQIWRC